MKPVLRTVIVLLPVLSLSLAAGCSKTADAPVTESLAAALPAGLKPSASILDLMQEPIATTADALWNTVGTVSTETGTKDLAPSTDEEWAAVRLKALTMMEAANLLVIEGRAVANPGQTLKDPPGEGDLTPAQAQAEIDKDRPAFVAFSAALQAAGGALLAAVDKHDVDAFSEAGGTLDEVCEGCHKRFWYPGGGVPAGL